MRILVLSVGRPRHQAAGRLFDEYAGRMRGLGVQFEARSVREVAAGGQYSDAHVIEREADRLRAALPDRGNRIAVDREGKLLDSKRLARMLEAWARPAATFVIGGPLGLAPSIVNACGAAWSLSPLTFPHEIARVLVAEQIYRAATLLRGIPYHK